MHCVPYGSLGEYVLGPLSGEEREYEEDPCSPLAMCEKKRAWVGVVELPADRRARGTEEGAGGRGQRTSSAAETGMSFHN